MPGSSPRVRGTPSRNPVQPPRPGIIPACAGNTQKRTLGGEGDRDHPRVCGEHFLPIHLMWSWSGSSPRVRGTLDCCRDHAQDAGIIPACAGNTFSFSVAYSRSWDHPRVCGEHPWIAVQAVENAGSSPRVRGTRGQDECVEVAVGIIPACAGNTLTTGPPRRWSRDHPRVCGEHPGSGTTSLRREGSSPRVRGTLHGAGVPH